MLASARFPRSSHHGYRHRRGALRPIHSRLDAVRELRATTLRRQQHERPRAGAHLPHGREPVARLTRPARHDGSARHRGRRRSRVGCGGSRARRQLRGVRCLGDGREDARPRLQPPLTEDLSSRRAPVRASSGTHHPPARFRSGGGGTDPALDGDRLDHRGARLRFPACPAVRALGLRDQHAHRDGAGAEIDFPSSSSRATARSAPMVASSSRPSPSRD